VTRCTEGAGLIAASQILLDDAHKESNDPYEIGGKPKGPTVSFDVAATNGESSPNRKTTYFSQLARQSSRNSLHDDIRQSVSRRESAPDDSIIHLPSPGEAGASASEDGQPPVDEALRKRLLYALVSTSFVFAFVMAQGFSIYTDYLAKALGQTEKEVASHGSHSACSAFSTLHCIHALFKSLWCEPALSTASVHSSHYGVCLHRPSTAHPCPLLITP
jgi:hypothetical protein